MCTCVYVCIGPDITKKFLDANGLSLLVRSHEVKEEGYEVEAEGRLITIFSAPNYCDSMGNKGNKQKQNTTPQTTIYEYCIQLYYTEGYFIVLYLIMWLM